MSEIIATPPQPTEVSSRTATQPVEAAPGPAARAFGFWPMAVAVVALVAFAPILANGFVDWDDDRNFLENLAFRGLGPAQVGWAWRTYLLGVYQPLAWMLLEAQYAAWHLNPRGYHAVSLVLHAAVAVALYALTVALLERCLPAEIRRDRRAVLAGAATAAALFAAHPLRTEVVAWVSCQPYLPSIGLGLLAVLAYLRAHEPGRAGRLAWLAGSWLLLAAALLCKAVAVSVPAVLLILDVYPLRRLGPGRWLDRPARRAWLEKAPFVALSVVAMVIAVRAKEANETLAKVDRASISARIAQACYGATFYGVKTALPFDLVAHYPLPDRVALSAWPFWLAAAAVAVATAVAVALRRRWPGLLAAWASYLVVLAPNSGLVRISNQAAADRYCYAASMGGVVLLAYGLARLVHTGSRRVVAPAAVAVVGLILALAALSWQQSRAWRDPEALWTHALAHGGERGAEAHINMGAVLMGKGRLREAAEQFEEAIRIDPTRAEARSNLGAVLVEQARYDEAESQLVEALRLRPGHAEARNNLGIALAGRGDYDGAIVQLAEAARLRPDIATIRAHLGRLLARQGRLDEAIAQLAEAARLGPSLAPARQQLGRALARRGRDAEAAAAFAEAARLDPRDPVAHSDLGSALLQLGKADEARTHFDEALRLRPDSAEAHRGLGLALAGQGRPAEAAAELAEALRLNPNDVAASSSLGSTLIALGKPDEAIAQFREALRLRPDSAEAHHGLGTAMAGLGRRAEAAAEFEEALRLDPRHPRARRDLDALRP